MGLFSKLFNSSSETEDIKKLPWKTLTTMAQLESIKEKSVTKPQVIFKHSTRCGISRMVKNQFEKDFNFSDNAFDLYYLDLLTYRDISNEIQNSFRVQHESPQLIVVNNQEVVANASHGGINDMDLAEFVTI